MVILFEIKPVLHETVATRSAAALEPSSAVGTLGVICNVLVNAVVLHPEDNIPPATRNP